MVLVMTNERVKIVGQLILFFPQFILVVLCFPYAVVTLQICQKNW